MELCLTHLCIVDSSIAIYKVSAFILLGMSVLFDIMYSMLLQSNGRLMLTPGIIDLIFVNICVHVSSLSASDSVITLTNVKAC